MSKITVLMYKEKKWTLFFQTLWEPVHPSVAQGLQRTKIELSLTTVGFTTGIARESTNIWKGSNQNMA